MKTRTMGLALVTLGFAAALSASAFRASAQEHMPGMGGMAHNEMDVDRMIATAKTPADHEAIAKHFDAEAAEAKERAEAHKKMGTDYKSLGGAVVSKWHLDTHCESLAKSAAAEAKEYQALAEAHREMAKAAK